MGVPLHEHWSSQSIPILLNVYEAIDFVHNTYRNAEPDGALACAAHLFSRAYVTNLRYSSSVDDGVYDEINKELRVYMGRALRLISEALSKPGGAMRDDILATVWILANYEILVGALPARASPSTLPVSPWHIHTQGMYSILKARGIDYLKTEKGRIGFWPAFNMVQIQSLIFSTESPPETDAWLSAFEDTVEPGERLTLRISRFIQEIASIQCRIMKTLRSKDVPNASHVYRGLWQELTTADQSLADWIDKQPPFTHAIDPYMRNMQYSTLVKTYHIMQLLINFLTHFAGCKIPLDELLANRRYCLQTIRGAAQGILQNVPYAIGPLSRGKDKSPRVLFDALKLSWPLVSIYVASSTVLPEQSALALELLIFIGKEIGVRQALRAKPQINLVPDEAISPLDVDAASLELPWVQLPSNLSISLEDCVGQPRVDTT
ncbi:Putative Expressed protein [[Torrubiella] hemipterigena]|nr:Putative Expressed protein [[Torrubiella] hemipterigena]